MRNLFFLMFLLVCAGCSRFGQSADAAPSPLPARPVAMGVVESEGGLVRIVAPRDGATGAPLVMEGDHVEAGQPLLRLDDRQSFLTLEVAAAELADRRAQVDIAAAKAAGALRDAQRSRRLAAADAGSRLDAERADTAAAVAAGERRQAAAALATAEARRNLQAFEVSVRDVRAPASGRIVRRTAVAGSYVGTGAPLFVLAPDGRRVVRAELDEAAVGSLAPGMTAMVSREFQAGPAFKAQILRVSDLLAAPVFNDELTPKPDSRVVTVILALPDNADLRIGQKVLVRFAS